MPKVKMTEQLANLIASITQQLADKSVNEVSFKTKLAPSTVYKAQQGKQGQRNFGYRTLLLLCQYLDDPDMKPAVQEPAVEPAVQEPTKPAGELAPWEIEQ